MGSWKMLLLVAALSAITANPANAGFIVSSGNAVFAYGDTGAFDGVLVSQGSGGLNAPHGLLLTGDGHLLVSGNNGVNSYDATTGAFLGAFAHGGGLSVARGMAFAADGSLLVSSYGTHQVLRYNGLTGDFMGVFASSSSLSGPSSLLFGPDGKLYVGDFDRGAVDRFDANGTADPAAGQTGALFVAPGSGGLRNPNMGLAFGPDGSLFVGSFATNSILEYNSLTGAFSGIFVPNGSNGLSNPQGMAFNGNDLYVVSQSSNRVMSFDATTGAFRGDLVGSGLSNPTNILFSPPTAAVPEPSSIVNVTMGLLSIGGFMFYRRKRSAVC